MKLTRDWEKMYISKGEENFYNCKFSKVNTLRKGRAGAQSQEEICPKFIQGEEHGEFLLVSRD